MFQRAHFCRFLPAAVRRATAGVAVHDLDLPPLALARGGPVEVDPLRGRARVLLHSPSEQRPSAIVCCFGEWDFSLGKECANSTSTITVRMPSPQMVEQIHGHTVCDDKVGSTRKGHGKGQFCLPTRGVARRARQTTGETCQFGCPAVTPLQLPSCERLDVYTVEHGAMGLIMGLSSPNRACSSACIPPTLNSLGENTAACWEVIFPVSSSEAKTSIDNKYRQTYATSRNCCRAFVE